MKLSIVDIFSSFCHEMSHKFSMGQVNNISPEKVSAIAGFAKAYEQDLDVMKNTPLAADNVCDFELLSRIQDKIERYDDYFKNKGSLVKDVKVENYLEFMSELYAVLYEEYVVCQRFSSVFQNTPLSFHQGHVRQWVAAHY